MGLTMSERKAVTKQMARRYESASKKAKITGDKRTEAGHVVS